jgi:hypothetical protein
VAILATLDRTERYLREGVLDKRTGLGHLAKHGVSAEQNITATPSLTAEVPSNRDAVEIAG